MSVYGKMPSSRKSVQQYSMPQLLGKGTTIQRANGMWRERPRAIKSNGIGTSPAFDQQPIVMTVNTEADPAIRSKNPRYVVPGNYVADIDDPKVVYNCARGEVAYQVIRENRVENTKMLSGTLFARVETTVTNLDVRAHIRIVGVFLNPGISKGVPTSNDDPLGVVQTGGSHETTNTGQGKIEVNDIVYCMAQACSISDSSTLRPVDDVDGPLAYVPSNRASVQVHGHSPKKMLLQTIAFHSSNKQFNIISLCKTHRALADALLNPARQQAMERAGGNVPTTQHSVNKGSVIALIDEARKNHRITNFGAVFGYYHWVLLDMTSYVYTELKELGDADATQAAYLKMVDSLVAFYTDTPMTDGDADRWNTAIRSALPLTLTPNAYIKTKWDEFMPYSRGGNHRKHGSYMYDKCLDAKQKCLAAIDYFMANHRLGRAMSEASPGGSFTVQISAGGSD